MSRHLVGPRRALLKAAASAAIIPIGAPVDLGTAVQTTSIDTAIEITTGADVGAGKAILVLISSTNSATISSVADSLGNTYSLGASFNSAGNILQCNFISAATLIPAGTVITITFSAALGRKIASAIMVSGLATSGAHDATGAGAGAAATSATPTVASGTLAQANELLVAFTYINTGSVDAWTEDVTNGWTSMGNAPSIDTRILRIAWKITTSTAPVTYAPTNGTIGTPVSRAWVANIDSFKGLAA